MPVLSETRRLCALWTEVWHSFWQIASEAGTLRKNMASEDMRTKKVVRYRRGFHVFLLKAEIHEGSNAKEATVAIIHKLLCAIYHF